MQNRKNYRPHQQLAKLFDAEIVHNTHTFCEVCPRCCCRLRGESLVATMSYDLLGPSFFDPPFAFFISASVQIVRLYREAAALTDHPWQDEGDAPDYPFATPPQPPALVAYRRCSV